MRSPSMTLRRTLIALGLILAVQAPAHAAHWSLLEPGVAIDLLDQSGSVDGQSAGLTTLGTLQDLSVPGQQALFDSQATGVQPLGYASLDQGSSQFVSVDPQGGSA